MGGDNIGTCNGSLTTSQQPVKVSPVAPHPGSCALTPPIPHTNQPGPGVARFSIGERVICIAAFDQRDHVGQIVDTRPLGSDVDVFVHYDNCDKRLDEWVPATRLKEFNEELANGLSIRTIESDAAGDGRVLRGQKRNIAGGKLDALDGKHGDIHEDEAKAHPLKAKHIEVIEFGEYEINTWYHSPYPPPFDHLQRLHICQFSMKYFRKRKTLKTHTASLNPDQRHPPGTLIYSSPLRSHSWTASTKSAPTITALADPQIVVWEVDGEKQRTYCQFLCLMSKLFLDGKTLFWEVHEFMFYLLCERLPDGDHVVGYFSREKNNDANHLACFLIMPHKQRLGFGGFIIDLSYKLARKMGKVGTPERPFSDLGRYAFKEYWERTLLRKLSDDPKTITNVNELINRTGIAKDDVIATLGAGGRFGDLKLIQYLRGEYVLHNAENLVAIETLYRQLITGKHRLVVDSSCLDWSCPAPRLVRQ